MPADAKTPRPIDLPLSTVVLYSSGVGYFEHAGQVEGDQRMVLQFTPDQIRDVLKSMVLSDADGGRIDSVSYPSQEPIERALQSFDIDLSDEPTLAEMLNDLRGCELTAHGSEAITGRLLSIDPTERIFGEPRFKQSDFTLSITTARGIEAAALSGISRIELADPQLQDELNRALSLIAQSRNRQRRPVEVRFRGEGTRRVRVGYLVDTAVWKTSYRLDLDGETPTLQGWAIVDNTSDYDWRGVRLSLVSGQPISFIQDLYTPLHAQRPEVRPKLAPGVSPQLYGEGIAFSMGVAGGAGDSEREADAAYDQVMLRKSASRSAPEKKRALAAVGQQSTPAPSLDPSQGVRAIADGATIGELFSYTIAAPVDLDRRSSGMLPIYTGPIEGKKISIYNEAAHRTRPLNGAALTNSTGLKLLGGPITVFDAGYYAGDAQIEHLPPGDGRLLSYAVDLEMTVHASERNHRLDTAVKIVKGVLTLKSQYTKTRTYTILNKAEQARSLVIEYPRDTSYELAEPADFEEKTPGLYRFRRQLEAGEQAELTVKTQRSKSQGVSLTQTSITGLHHYASDDDTDPQLASAIAKAVKLRQTLDDIEARLLPQHESIKEIEGDQERINKNLKGVGPDTALGKRYLAKLNTQEDRLESIRAEIDTLSARAEQARRALSDYLAGLTVGA